MPKTYGKVTETIGFKEAWYDLEVTGEEIHHFTYGDVLELTFKLPDGRPVVSIASLKEDISPRTKLYKWVVVLLDNPPEQFELKEGMFIGKTCRGYIRVVVGSRGPFLKAITLERNTEGPRRAKPDRSASGGAP